MAITAVGSLVQTTGATGQTSVTITPTAVGNAVLLLISTASTTLNATAVSGGSCTWAQVGTNASDTTLGVSMTLWLGTATSTTGAAATITFNTSAGATTVGRRYQEFTAGLGAATTWSVDNSGQLDNASSTTVTYPSLVATGAGELYFGHAIIPNTVAAGGTTGFTYVTASNGNQFAYNPASSGTVAPTSSQSPAGVSLALAGLLTASGNVSLSRTATDTAAASDTVSRAAQTFTRAASDTAGASDVAAKSVPRALTDTAAAADAVARVVALTRPAPDTAAAADVAAKAAQTFTRGAADTAGASDGRAATVESARGGDTATASDAVARAALAFSRSTADTAAAVDTLVRVAALPRTVADLAQAGDSTTSLVVRSINASPNWPLMGFEVDFQNGPPAYPGINRMSINAPYRRLYVRKFDIHRGRQYELDQVQAGTCTMDISDRNELLNPDNTSSPFNQGPGSNKVTPYRSMWVWAMWPNQPGSGNIINTKVSANYDPSFESGTGTWGAGAGTTVAQSSAQAFTGTKSLLVTQNAAGPTGAQLYVVTAPVVTYSFSCYVYPTGGCTVQAQVTDANGVVTTSGSAAAQNVWQRISFTWTTVDTLEKVIVYGTGAATPTFYVDATMLEFGSVLHAYTASGPTLYPIFTGFVERYPTKFDMSGMRATRPLQAVDALAILSRTAINQSYDTEVAADNPVMYWRLDNTVSPATATQLDQGGRGTKLGVGMGPGAVPYYNISPSGSINWGGDAHLDGTPAVAFTGQNSTNPPTAFAPNSFTEMPVQGGTVTLNPQTGFTWECWVRWVSGTTQVGTLEVIAPGDPFGLNYNVPMIAAGDFSFNNLYIIYNPDGSPAVPRNRLQRKIFPDNAWHYLYLTVSGGTLRFGFDDLGLSTNQAVTSVGPIAFNTFYSEASAQYTIAQAQNSTGRFAVYGAVLSATRLAAHYQRGIGYYGEKSGARIARLLGKYWAGATSVAAGTALMAPDFTYSPIATGGQASQARTVLDVAQEIQDTERGLFYTSAAGVVVFEDRSSRYLSQVASVVFGENPAGASPVEWPYADITYDHDPTYTFSQANLTRPANNAFPVRVNTATQANYGQRIITQTVQVNQDFDLTQAGIFYLVRYGTPVTRVATLILDPAANPALFPIILGLELSQRVTVTRRSAFTRTGDYYIEKIEHQIAAESSQWTVTLQLSPVFNPTVWVLGDATFGVLGSTTIPIY